ncbi:winged helix-turn-helix transcriptional regulator [Nocardia sp. NPDC051990]|uniref:winged helix-turn-helix transcriptional regulator n=1 Tax=Nocardia sp. NPDC051990 TaxID=3155285 RepID=UPI00343724C6
MLTRTLRNLERDGLVHRAVYPTVPAARRVLTDGIWAPVPGSSATRWGSGRCATTAKSSPPATNSTPAPQPTPNLPEGPHHLCRVRLRLRRLGGGPHRRTGRRSDRRSR